MTLRHLLLGGATALPFCFGYLMAIGPVGVDVDLQVVGIPLGLLERETGCGPPLRL